MGKVPKESTDLFSVQLNGKVADYPAITFSARQYGERAARHEPWYVDRRSIWEIVEEVNAWLPADTWDNVPTDGSINLDHYLCGAPKQQP